MSKVSCSIITIGDEILFGHILDTNSKWLSQELNKVGVKILEKKSIGDDYDQINYSVKNSLYNYDMPGISGEIIASAPLIMGAIRLGRFNLEEEFQTAYFL